MKHFSMQILNTAVNKPDFLHILYRLYYTVQCNVLALLVFMLMWKPQHVL